MQTARAAGERREGSRQATLLFPPGTTATMTLPDGSTQPLSSLSVRATEYTVGSMGPRAMPAALPASSGYTYAAELSVDEASARTTVQFSQPVVSYTENFVGFPVGTPVPVGYYDRARAAWMASDNGRVIKVLTVTGGLAELDLDGSGTPASPAALAALGGHRRRAPATGRPLRRGAEPLARPISHFSPMRLQLAVRAPEGAKGLRWPARGRR